MWFWIVFICVIYIPYVFWGAKMSRIANRIKSKQASRSQLNPVGFSIVIPFRNENGVVQNLVTQLADHLKNDSRLELILVDDHSEDGGLSELQSVFGFNPQITFLENTGTGKKAAITTAIEIAQNDWIVTLDADVAVPVSWINYISGICAYSNKDLIILPVEISPAEKFWQKVESLEFTVLQGLTFNYAFMDQPFLANGAHLAFRKKAFMDLKGYSSHMHLASGDDVFLLEQMVSSPNHSVGFSYNSDMIVDTMPNKTFWQMIQQKVRWAKKTSKFSSIEAKKLAILVTLANLGLLVLLFAGQWTFLFLSLLIKTTVDYYLVTKWISINNTRNINFLPIFILLYPFYFTFVGVATLFIKPKWKGRKI